MAKRMVQCMVVYDSNKFQVYNVTVKTKEHHTINLFRTQHGYDKENTKKYKNFHQLETFVLKLLDNNNFKVYTWLEAGVCWYDIDFIDVHQLDINRYCYTEQIENI